MVGLPPAPAPVVIADYGSSPGRNSLHPMAVAIGVLRERLGPERAISVVHIDLPESDFTALFQTLQNEPESYLKDDSAVFASAIGRSFYQQVLPAGSVTLGWSSWAVQWLSRVPASIPDQLQVAYSCDPTARASFARQADADWRSFLTHRGKELCPGGRLVVLTMALGQSGDFGYRPVLQAMYAALLDLVEQGFLAKEEVRRMAIPTVGRSHADLAAPFAGAGSFAGLKLAQLEVFLGEDRTWQDYQRSQDAGAFGAGWAAFSRASVFPTLAAELDGGTSQRAKDFIERLEAGMAERLVAAPEPALIPLAKLVLVKDDN